jgi:hypothetical protein
MKPTPHNDGTFEIKGVHRERDMIHLWIGNNPWQGGNKKGEALIRPRQFI